MARRHFTMKIIIYVGMDVHKDTYSLCSYRIDTDQYFSEVECKADPNNVVNYLSKIKEQLPDDEVEFKTCYEAGCLGYSLHNFLTDGGIDNAIIAPTTITKTTKEKKRKNDRMDARSLAKNLAFGLCSNVYVPTQKDIDFKEYIRMRDSIKENLKRIKQQLLSLLLRHGFHFDEGKTNWTGKFFNWLNKLELRDDLKEVVNEYLDEYYRLTEKLSRIENTIEIKSQEEPYKDKVNAIACFSGISVISAARILVEISDFSRFKRAKDFTNYLGMTPGENSSGESIKGLSITKQGNSQVRRTFIECVQTTVRGRTNGKAKCLKKRQLNNTAAQIKYADKARVRLQGRFIKLMAKGMNRNKAIVACARELACFVWGMMTENYDLSLK